MNTSAFLWNLCKKLEQKGGESSRNGLLVRIAVHSRSLSESTPLNPIVSYELPYFFWSGTFDINPPDMYLDSESMTDLALKDSNLKDFFMMKCALDRASKNSASEVQIAQNMACTLGSDTLSRRDLIDHWSSLVTREFRAYVVESPIIYSMLSQTSSMYPHLKKLDSSRAHYALRLYKEEKRILIPCIKVF